MDNQESLKEVPFRPTDSSQLLYGTRLNEMYLTRIKVLILMPLIIESDSEESGNHRIISKSNCYLRQCFSVCLDSKQLKYRQSQWPQW